VEDMAYRKAAVGIPENCPRTSRTSRFGADVKKRTSWLLYFLLCKGYCGRVGHGTSRGSEGFSLLCNDRLNRSAYRAGDPKRKG